MKALPIAIICFLFTIGSVRTQCSDEKRKANMFVLLSNTFAKNWVAAAQGRSMYMLKEAVKTSMLAKLNEAYSQQFMQYGSVEFTITDVLFNPQETDDAWLAQNNGSSVLDPFCKEMKGRFPNAHAKIYVIDRSERTGRLPTGKVGLAFQGGICDDNYRCAIVAGQLMGDNVVERGLISHETAHLFGTEHATETCGGFMWITNLGKDWGTCTPLYFKQLFTTIKKYDIMGCVPNECGQSVVPTIPPGVVSDDDWKALDGVCVKTFGANWKFGAHYKIGYSTGDLNQDGDYFQILRENPEWYLASNVCKGVPCIYTNLRGGLFAKEMQGRTCGVNKVCQNGVCQIGTVSTEVQDEVVEVDQSSYEEE